MKILLSLFFSFIGLMLMSQVQLHSPTNTSSLPLWAQKMYSTSPNYYEVIDAYREYFSMNSFEKTIHTQYFKRWVSAVRHRVNPDGTIQDLNPQQRKNIVSNNGQLGFQKKLGTNIWNYAGPEHHVAADGTMTSSEDHSNVYCHDRSDLNPNKLYCGTESGGAYITIDGGQQWTSITHDLDITWVSSIQCKPNNDSFVIMSADNDLWRSTDDGQTWEVIGQPSFVSQNISAWELAFNPEDNDIVYAATNLGLFRSTDGGSNWIEVLANNCETVVVKPNNPSVVYAIHYENDLGYPLFYKSIDYGATFQAQQDGWFNQQLGDIQIDGGRLAVSAADPNRVYALLVGYQNPGSPVVTNGWVGVWVSYDSGLTWTLPHQLIGTPYSEEHPNLMNFDADNGDYTQIHYNTCIAVSQLDPDKVLIGGLNLWISNDACSTYQGLAGYIGGLDYFHVDQQEIHVYKTSETTEEVWISNDGGIAYSNNFLATHENRNRGIRAVNLWGYDQGWNEDMMVAGRYHNGNMGYHENYPEGEFLSLGGGEAATGYVSYNHENQAFFSDIQGRVLPEIISDTPDYIGLSLSPNESYWNNESSRILFDNDYYNIAWLGNENRLYRSTDGGSSYGLAYTFGTNPTHDVLWIEQSFSNHNVFYVHQATGNTCKLWRSVDHCQTFNEINLPLNLRYMNFTLSSSSAEELWVAYYDGANGQKVYKTENAGDTWVNWSTPILNNYSPWAIAHQYGTSGGVYLAMLNGKVFYRNNDLTDWQPYESGLPASTEPLRLVPFYKSNKLRLATWNLGVWEAQLYEPSELIANFSASYNSFFCPGDPIQFTDHSVCTELATYSWEFPGGVPSSSNLKNPNVIYESDGTYDVTLTVSQGGTSSTKTLTQYISSLQATTGNLEEDFETGAISPNWSISGSGDWSITEDASAFGEGNYSIRFDNFYFDAQGETADLKTTKFLAQNNMNLVFSNAYARYGEGYSDTLYVLLSTDCGSTWSELYSQGGTNLATAPDQQTFFVPEASQWQENNITISGVENGQECIIAFRNKGHYGNAIYLDNIMLSIETKTTEIASEIPSLAVFPSPANEFIEVSLRNASFPTARMEIFNSTGQLVKEEAIQIVGKRLEKRLTLSGLSDGYYVLRIRGDNFDFSNKFIVKKQ